MTAVIFTSRPLHNIVIAALFCTQLKCFTDLTDSLWLLAGNGLWLLIDIVNTVETGSADVKVEEEVQVEEGKRCRLRRGRGAG